MTTHANDLDLYERHANDWWDASSHTFRSLHAVSEFRIELLREWLGERLNGATVVDLGCGGGLLARPLAELGARILGVDLSRASLRMAAKHVDGVFVQGDVLRAPLAAGVADIVLLCDVVEHVPDVPNVLVEANRLLSRRGLLFVNTLNRNWRSKLLAVTVAEGIGLVPRGTHDPKMFVRPDELRATAAKLGLKCTAVQGEAADILRTLRRWAVTLRRSDDVSVGYSLLFARAGDA
jgi:2-polyprenyl-6-hydroxyphenyl methylase/3-demethylubiquinone-9 3-methyltransferase